MSRRPIIAAYLQGVHWFPLSSSNTKTWETKGDADAVILFQADPRKSILKAARAMLCNTHGPLLDGRDVENFSEADTKSESTPLASAIVGVQSALRKLQVAMAKVAEPEEEGTPW